jgi:hypothetical protein
MGNAMNLTQAQKTSLKASIVANTTSILNPTTGQQSQIKDIPLDDGGGNDAVAAWYNSAASPAFFIYYSTVPIAAIKGAIDWKKLTPVDSVPTDTTLNISIWSARAQFCDLCRANVMALMAMGTGGTIDCTPNKIVQGFSDALSSVPSAASGNTQDAGWTGGAGVRAAICRGNATNAEKVLASTVNGNGGAASSAAAATFEGLLNGSQIIDARTVG